MNRKSWNLGIMGKNSLPGLNQARPSTLGTKIQQQTFMSMADRNRASNIVYGQGNSQTGGGSIKTSNQAFYKWI